MRTVHEVSELTGVSVRALHQDLTKAHALYPKSNLSGMNRTKVDSSSILKAAVSFSHITATVIGVVVSLAFCLLNGQKKVGPSSVSPTLKASGRWYGVILCQLFHDQHATLHSFHFTLRVLHPLVSADAFNIGSEGNRSQRKYTLFPTISGNGTTILARIKLR